MQTILYRKVARFMNIDETTSIRNIFGKNKNKALNKAIKKISDEPEKYSAGVKRATIEDIREFYELYKTEISKKFNAKIYNVQEIFEKQLTEGKELYFSYLKENNILIAGGISCHKKLRDKNTLSGAAKIGKDIKIEGLSVIYYVEYLFFSFGISLSVEQFSAGKDRNCYGYTGEGIGLAIHKLQNHYLPYQSSDTEEFELNENDITQETILFIPNTNKGGICDKAIFRTNKTQIEIEEEFCLFKKRGISLEIRSLAIK